MTTPPYQVPDTPPQIYGRRLLADSSFWDGMRSDTPGKLTDHVAGKLGEAAAKWAEEEGAGQVLQTAAGAAGPIFESPWPAAAKARHTPETAFAGGAGVLKQQRQQQRQRAAHCTSLASSCGLE